MQHSSVGLCGNLQNVAIRLVVGLWWQSCPPEHFTGSCWFEPILLGPTTGGPSNICRETSQLLPHLMLKQTMRRSLEDLQNIGDEIPVDGNLVYLEYTEDISLVDEED
ncbi:hypothetical protein T265_13971, partial [Opisthorchis viverrini]